MVNCIEDVLNNVKVLCDEMDAYLEGKVSEPDLVWEDEQDWEDTEEENPGEAFLVCQCMSPYADDQDSVYSQYKSLTGKELFGLVEEVNKKSISFARSQIEEILATA